MTVAPASVPVHLIHAKVGRKLPLPPDIMMLSERKMRRVTARRNTGQFAAEVDAALCGGASLTGTLTARG
jgi:hypothetical protein